MISQSQIDDIREAANDDIIAIVEAYGPKNDMDLKVNRRGTKAKGFCPFHDEKTPSFHVTEEKGIYKCFGCGEGGDAINFVMEMEGMDPNDDFIECIRELAGFLNIPIHEVKGDRPQNYTPPSTVIPGIREAKRHIRKEERALLCFNKEDVKQLQTQGKKNAVYLPAYRPAQVELIAKYTDTVVIYPKGLNRRKFFKALEITHRQNIGIKLAKYADSEASYWAAFIKQHFGASEEIRGHCIRIIGAIENSLKREIETQRFTEIWTD